MTLLQDGRPMRVLYGYADDVPPHATAEVRIGTSEECAALPNEYTLTATTM